MDVFQHLLKVGTIDVITGTAIVHIGAHSDKIITTAYKAVANLKLIRYGFTGIIPVCVGNAGINSGFVRI